MTRDVIEADKTGMLSNQVVLIPSSANHHGLSWRRNIINICRYLFFRFCFQVSIQPTTDIFPANLRKTVLTMDWFLFSTINDESKYYALVTCINRALELFRMYAPPIRSTHGIDLKTNSRFLPL